LGNFSRILFSSNAFSREMFKNKKLNFLILTALFAATIFIWSTIFSLLSGDVLKVVFFDIGQGDSIFIETPAKRQILIDGGPDKSVLEKLGEAMPFYDRSIDLVILTHPDSDHITGLVSVLEYFEVGHILVSGFKGDSAVYSQWEKIIEEKKIPLTVAQAGQKVIFPSGAVLEILWPDQSRMETISLANNASVVGRLIYGNSKMILTGDIEKKVENLLGENSDLRADILKTAHHGGKTSTGEGFLNAVSPEAAVVSVGKDNRYGHPSREVLDRLGNIAVYRTDEEGDIKILTDGNFFNIITER